MVTPIRPTELILGKTLPFVLIGFFDMLLVMAAALLIFRVPFVGSFGLLCLAALLFIMTTLGAGLFIFHRVAYATVAGEHGDLSFLSAVFHAERVHVSHPQHAHGGAVFHLSEPHAVLPGSRPRCVFEGLGVGHTVAEPSWRWA